MFYKIGFRSEEGSVASGWTERGWSDGEESGEDGSKRSKRPPRSKEEHFDDEIIKESSDVERQQVLRDLYQMDLEDDDVDDG